MKEIVCDCEGIVEGDVKNNSICKRCGRTWKFRKEFAFSRGQFPGDVIMKVYS